MKMRKSTTDDSVAVEINKESNRECFVFCGLWKSKDDFRIPGLIEGDRSGLVGYFFAVRIPSGAFWGGADFTSNQRVSSFLRRLEKWSGDPKCRLLGCTSPYHCDLTLASLAEYEVIKVESEKSRLSCASLVPYG
jgi:hypothetical protein